MKEKSMGELISERLLQYVEENCTEGKLMDIINYAYIGDMDGMGFRGRVDCPHCHKNIYVVLHGKTGDIK